MEFAGKVAIVTGGASGIGQAIATELTENGATVAIADQLEDVGPETARGLESRGFKASFFPVDVSDAAEVESMVKSVVEAYGAVDILVNNAGIGQRCSILEMAVDEWDRVLAVNLKGAFLCSQAVGKEMVKQGTGGRIISIVSTAAENARVNAAAYCASKAGILQFTRVLAQELGQYGITANAVGPGLTVTGSPLREPPSEVYLGAFLKEVPLARPGDPRDVALTVAFLASPRADYITGQVIYADGGYSAGKLSVQD